MLLSPIIHGKSKVFERNQDSISTNLCFKKLGMDKNDKSISAALVTHMTNLTIHDLERLVEASLSFREIK
jgi:hypothetical protein